MKITTYPYQLQFKYPFRITHGMRTHTDVVYVKIEHEGYTGWGEATLPPYLKETQQSVTEFINAFANQVKGLSKTEAENVLRPGLYNDNTAARAALHTAFWNLPNGKGPSLFECFRINETVIKKPLNTYTIGVCPANEMQLKIEEANAAGFEMFKLKLNGENDDEVVSTFRSLSSKPFAVDVNQGWKSVTEALQKIRMLEDYGCLLVEQPLPVSMDNLMPALKEKSSLPLYGDESCWNANDLRRLNGCFDGVNIKLMKCGGPMQGMGMIEEARRQSLKVLIGCMSESSVGCNAAAYLATQADYTDLDGPWLISNDPFKGIKLENGCVVTTVVEQLKKL